MNLRRIMPLLVTVWFLSSTICFGQDKERAPGKLSSEITLPMDVNTDISDRVDVLLDQKAELTIQDILSKKNAFKRNTVPAYSPGPFPGYLWIHINLNFAAGEDVQYFLNINAALMDAVLYVVEDGQVVREFIAGRRDRGLGALNTIMPSFPLSPSKAKQEYYLRLQNDLVYTLKMSVNTAAVTLESTSFQANLAGIYSGIMIIMILYNLFLYYSTKEREFLWYSISVFFVHLVGIGNLLHNNTLLGRSFPYLIEYQTILGKILGIMFFINFSRMFLKTAEMARKFDSLLKILMGACFFMLFTLLFLPAARVNLYFNAIVLASLISVIIFSGRLFYQGVRYARYYFLAWFPVLLVGVATILLNSLGLGHLITNSNYFLGLAACVEVLLLSMALGDKINILRVEKEREEAKNREEKARRDEEQQTFVLKMNKELEEKVKEKTASIRALLDNIPLAVVAVDGDANLLPEMSKYSKRILHDPHPGQSVLDAVFQNAMLSVDEVDGFLTGLKNCVSNNEFGYEANAGYLIESFTRLQGKKNRYYENHWAPIISEEGSVTSLLLCVGDVTEKTEIKKASETQEEKNKIILELLHGRSENLLPCLQRLSLALDDFTHVCGMALDRLRKEKVEILFRALHTEKANARSWKFVKLAEVIHILEDFLQKMRNQEAVDVKLWQQSVEKFELARMLYTEIHDSLKETMGGASQVLPATQDFEHIVLALTSEIKSIADSTHKAVPELRLSFIPKQTLATDSFVKLSGILLHLIRNAIDHGLELPEERLRKSKPVQGVIHIEFKQDDQHVYIQINDDGRGLNKSLVKEKARQKFQQNTELDLAQLPAEEILFLPGFSTASKISDISGRGVGLDAVRVAVRELGGDIRAVCDSQQADVSPLRFLLNLRKDRVLVSPLAKALPQAG